MKSHESLNVLIKIVLSFPVLEPDDNDIGKNPSQNIRTKINVLRDRIERIKLVKQISLFTARRLQPTITKKIFGRYTRAPKAWLNHGLPGCKPG